MGDRRAPNRDWKGIRGAAARPLSISRKLAYSKGSRMTFKDCLSHWGNADFAEMLLEELCGHADEFELQDWCQHGGSPSAEADVFIQKLVIREATSEFVKGSFEVSFTESIYRGCKDHDFTEKHRGQMEFRLDRETGEVEYNASDAPEVRQYEPDEF